MGTLGAVLVSCSLPFAAVGSSRNVKRLSVSTISLDCPRSPQAMYSCLSAGLRTLLTAPHPQPPISLSLFLSYLLY
jgi:hypothetical protein